MTAVRIAMLCTHKDCFNREFDNPKWKCPQHGVSKRQPNNVYLGKPTPSR